MMPGLGKQALFGVAVIVGLFFSNTLLAASCEKLDDWSMAAVEEESLLITLLRVNNRPVSQAFEVYAYENTYLIPVTALNQLLQLGWEIDRKTPSLMSSEDDAIADLCSFSIMLPKSAGQSGLFWAQDDFDIYIDIAALPHIFGGSAEYQFSLLQLNILADTDFPGLGAAAAIPDLVARHGLLPDRVVADRYRPLTPAIINYRLAGNYNSEQSDGRLTASSNAFFDVANHALELRVNANESNTQQFLRFSKNLDITGDEQAANFLRYEVGDIQLQSDELIHRSTSALGVSIFNFDPSYTRSFSQVTIEETLLPGWRAQLFRNGQFLQERFSNEQNLVVFEQVDTFHGTNLFEIKLYGPEGQEEVRYQTIKVGTQQLTPGKFNYSFNVSDAGKRFIDSDNAEARYDQNLSALLAYGLSHNTTIEASMHSVRGLEQQQDFASSALYVNFTNAALKTQWVKDLDAGNALFVGLNANIARALRANFSARYFDDFESAAYPQSRDIKAEAQLRLNGQLAWWQGVSWSSSIQHRSYNERENTNEVSLSLSKNLLGGTLSSSLAYQDALADEHLRHRVLWSTNIAGWQFSNSIEWLPQDDQQIRSYYSVIRWPQQYDTYNQSRIEYRANREDKVLFTHLFNWRQESFNLQFGGSVSDGGDWTVNLGISGDIEYDMFDQQFNYYRPRGSVANIHALAYLDNNRNALFDTGDETLSGVGMIGNGNWRERRTDGQGLMQLATNARVQAVHIDDITLPDPFMVPVDTLVHVNTHRGGINWVPLAVMTFNDVEGAVYRTTNNSSNSRGVNALTVQLVDPKLNVVGETQTEMDGYFFFSRIPPGQYTLQLDTQYLENNDLTMANAPQRIDAPMEGDSLRINDVLLVERSQAPQLPATPEQKLQAPAEPELKPKLAAQLTRKPALPVELHKKPDAVEVDKFYVQLGAFKKLHLIKDVLKYLPTNEYDVKIFRNHLTGLSYVVAGGYASQQNARLAAEKLKDMPQFTRAYVSAGSRYLSSGWDLEYQLLDMAEHLQLSHQVIREAPADSYFCQLVSYSSLKPISADGLNNMQVVHVAHRQVNNKGFYTLYTGPVANPLECQKPSLNQLTPDAPFALSSVTLRTQLVENP
jgi:hypothetical protein